MKYRVTITEQVYYAVDVEADDEEQAKEFGLEEHADGASFETDTALIDEDTHAEEIP